MQVPDTANKRGIVNGMPVDVYNKFTQVRGPRKLLPQKAPDPTS
jgi:anaerobic selenocysteine-containing dehydrogenase